MLGKWSWVGIWQKVTEPASTIIKDEEKRRARLLAAITPIGFIGTLVTLPLIMVTLSPGTPILQQPLLWPAIVALAAYAVSYALSRTRFYIAGALVAVTFLVLVVYFTYFTVPGITDILVAMLVPVIIATLILPTWGTVVAVVMMSIVMIGTLTTRTGSALTPIIIIFALNLVVSMMIMIFAFIRQNDLNQIESQARKLENALHDAEAAARAKDQFMATMSHELRTPLHGIIGQSGLILHGMTGDLSDKQKHKVDTIHQSAEHLLSLINEILDLDRIQGGRVKVELRRVELKPMIDGWIDQIEPRLKEKGLALEVKVDTLLPNNAVTDSRLLTQIALNLLENALKFTDSGKVMLGIDWQSDKPALRIKVQDSGIGIPPHERDLIFKEFQRGAAVQQQGRAGTGLGLAITDRLVKAMNGSVVVDSEGTGKGSTFTVTVPVTTN
jgi:signal transduction histidine kinase